MIGLHVSAAVAVLLLYFRLRDRRLLLLASMFAARSAALVGEPWQTWSKTADLTWVAAGLVLAYLLGPKNHPPSTRTS